MDCVRDAFVFGQIDDQPTDPTEQTAQDADSYRDKEKHSNDAQRDHRR